MLISELCLRICNMTMMLKVCLCTLIDNMLSSHHIFLQLLAGCCWSVDSYSALGLWQLMSGWGSWSSWGLWGVGHWLELMNEEWESRSVTLTIIALWSLLRCWILWVWWYRSHMFVANTDIWSQGFLIKYSSHLLLNMQHYYMKMIQVLAQCHHQKPGLNENQDLYCISCCQPFFLGLHLYLVAFLLL